MARVPVELAALLVLMTPSLAAGAERPTATLDYARQGGAAEQCPDAATFRALVAAKLGYDPFAPSASAELHVALRRAGSSLTGTLKLTAGGAPRGERTLHAAVGDCDELAASLALAAAVAIDPDSVAQPAVPPIAPVPPTPSPPPASMSNAVPNAVPNALSVAARHTLAPRVTAGVFVPWGLTPGVTAGLRLGVGLDAGAWFIDLEGSATLASSHDTDVGSVSASLYYATLVPCWQPTLADRFALALCAAGSLGATRSNASHVTRASPQTDVFAAVGPRAGIEVFPWRSFGFGAGLELPISLSRVHLLIDEHGQQREVWASSRVGMMAGFSLIFRPK